MRPRTKSAALWGTVSAFLFVTASLGYLLVGGRFVSVPTVAALTPVVGVATATCAYVLEMRLLKYGR